MTDTDTPTHILYLRKAVDEIKADVKTINTKVDSLVTKDDCRDRHDRINHDVGALISRTEFMALRKDLDDLEENVEGLKKPLWGIVISFAGAVFAWFFTRGGSS